MSTPLGTLPPGYLGGDGASTDRQHRTPIGFEHLNEQSNAKPHSSLSAESHPMSAYTVDENASLMERNGNGESQDVKLYMNMNDESPGKNTLFFRDGIKRVDYVLAYQDNADEVKTCKRQQFEADLEHRGLELEREDKRFSQDGQTYFVKVHIPWKLLLTHAELMRVKLPIKTNDSDAPRVSGFMKLCGPCQPSLEPEEDFYTAAFYKDGVFLGYDGPNKPNDKLFSNSQRSRIVHEILQRAQYGEMREQFGYKRLLKQGIYTAVYPLHDGLYRPDNKGESIDENCRKLLFDHWARPGVFMKEQPFDAIRNYFGEKVAIYFSWLGFYTWMLVPASVVGIIVFLYGLITMPLNKSSNEICEQGSNYTMCPQCDERCEYWKLNISCTYSKVAYVVDNGGTIFFAVFMSLWSAMFTEMWKRHQARIEFDWDVADFEEAEQTIRPEFQASSLVTAKKKNPITHEDEPDLPSWRRFTRLVSSMATVLFLICVVLAAIMGIIIYRVVIVALLSQNPSLPQAMKNQSKLITTITAAILSLLIISILNKLYEFVAIFLTNLETWKYENEWEDSFTFKMYIFQFVNYYGTIFYIAFFKGSFVGHPKAYNTVQGGYRLDECDPAGCLIELAIQLAIVMVGKQALNNTKEIIIPLIKRFIKMRKSKKTETKDDKYTSWERDYDLVDFPPNGLYEEYLEMVIQYGFVTLFVAAFPLAPFFALLNNIIEVRLDAMKLVTQLKRPMAARAQDIGTWFYALNAISKLAVLSNACIIAFTSDFIQKSIYQYSENTNNLTYIDWSLSSFRTADFQNGSMPSPNFESKAFGDLNRTNHICRYRDFRNGPGTPNWDGNYDHTAMYWKVLTARLAFVVVFEHVVLLIVGLIDFLIPDVPEDIKENTLREKHLTKVALLERIKAGKGQTTRPGSSMGSVEHHTSL